MGTPVYGPRDIAVDRAKNIYLADRGAINKLDSTGRYLTTFNITPASNPLASVQTIGVDGAGNIYACSYNSSSNDFVRKYGPDGRLLLQFGSLGTGPGQFREVHGMYVDAPGNIYVVDYTNQRMQSFTSQGILRFAYQMPNPTSNPRLIDVDVDATGNIYLLEEAFVVTKLNAAGQLIARIPLAGTWASYQRTSALLVDGAGNLLVSGSQLNLMKFSATGAYLGSGTASNANQFTSSTWTPLARDAAGNVYATVFTHQIFSDCVYKLSPTGVQLQRWGNQTSLSDMRQDEAGNVYVLDNNTNQVRKYNPAGQLALTFGGSGTGNGQFSRELAGLAFDALNNIYVLETTDLSSSIQKFDARGQFLARFQNFGTGTGYQRFSGLAVDAAGTMFVSDYYGGCVRKISPQGIFLNTIGTRGTSAGQLFVPKAVAVDLRGNVYAADYDGRRVQKFSATGQILQQYGPSPNPNSSVTVCEVDLDVDGQGRVYVVSTVHPGIIFAANGSSQMPMPTGSSRVSVNRRATKLLTMSAKNDLIQFYVSASQPPENFITGQIFHDANNNCSPDAPELLLAGLVVVAEPGNYYGVTDETGSFVISVDTGRYTVRQLLPENEVGRTIQQSCATNPPIMFRGYGSSIGSVNFGNQVSTAPFLRVNVASNRRRRCFRNITTVAYANAGYAPATTAVVTVAFPPEVVLLSASAPYTQNALGQYVFAVGTVPPNTAGSLVIQDSVVCGNPSLRGLTVCTRAWITPSNTYPPPPTWSRASVQVLGYAQPGNQARFVIRNTGAGSMSDSLALRVYQNSQLALQHPYALAAGDSLVLRIPATQPVVRVEAEQPVGHPTQRVASATVEVRGLATPGQPSPTLPALPYHPPSPETAEDCQPILDSYDPNDKQVHPVGVTAQHYTPTGVPLHYRVRFQNTGNDDAYRVEVVDTLAADLDPRTLRVEAASHPYRMSVSGRGRLIVSFTFDNINLPPSVRNDAGSNGFVQFSIQPKASLPPRAQVDNYADIFFDYNPPIRTNSTINRLYDMPLVVIPAVALNYSDIVVSPTITRVAPAQGRVGTMVTVIGQRFSPTTAANQVRFNGVLAPALTATATTLTVRVPTGATTGSLQVATADGTARSVNFTVYQAPTLTSIAPTEGLEGTLVTLTGTHFSAVAAEDTVWFNGLPATVRQATATALQVVVPAGATSGKIQLKTLGGGTVSAQDFTVWYPPTITDFRPARGKVGDILTVMGRNFAPPSRTTVALGAGSAAVLQTTETSLQARVLADAQTGRLQVVTPGGTAQSATNFTFLPPPTVVSFSPTRGSVGEILTIAGTNFLVDSQPDSLYIGNVRAAVLSATTTSAVVRVPRGAQPGPVTVAGIGGRSESSQLFQLVDLLPEDAIRVYPNPAHGAAVLEWQHADFTLEQVQAYSALGQLLVTADLRHQTEPRLQLTFAGNPTGLCLLVIHTSRGTVTKKIALY